MHGTMAGLYHALNSTLWLFLPPLNPFTPNYAGQILECLKSNQQPVRRLCICDLGGCFQALRAVENIKLLFPEIASYVHSCVTIWSVFQNQITYR